MKKNMSEKGFTLIELLAVIIILGILMIIAIPAVSEYVMNSRKEGFSDSAKLIIDESKKRLLAANMNGEVSIYPAHGEYRTIPVNMLRSEKADLSNWTGYILIVNKNGEYKYYMNASDGKFAICGYEYDEIKRENVTTDTSCPELTDTIAMSQKKFDTSSSDSYTNKGRALTVYIKYNGDGIGSGISVAGNPLKDNIVMTSYSNWPAGFSLPAVDSFYGGVFDGESIWMIPNNADSVIKVNKYTGEMTRYNNWPAGFAKTVSATFISGGYDGESIWMIPSNADRIVKINKNTGVMTCYGITACGTTLWPAGFVRGIGTSIFYGSVYDGRFMWLVPGNSNMIVRLDTKDGTMVGYNSWPSGYVAGTGTTPFGGIVNDGKNVWLIPRDANMIIKVDSESGSMTGYNNWPSDFAKGSNSFIGGVYDGKNIWLVPHSANKLIKFDTSTNKMTSYATGGGFLTGVYDGENIWCSSWSNGKVLKVNTKTEKITSYNNWPSGFTFNSAGSFRGAVFDGNSVWLIPTNVNKLIKISSQ